MGRFQNFRNRVAELINTDSEPEPRGYAGEEQPTGTIVGNYLENNPPQKDLNEYWQLYRDVGIIQQAIDNFASEVVEPGWYITADSQETADELLEFMENVAVVNNSWNENFTVLAYKMVIEREVRGTVFLEKVYDDQGRPKALYPLQNDTITIYTKPGKAMLPAPHDDVAEPSSVKIGGESRIPRTPDGLTGAYVQFDDLKPRWNHREEVVYTREDVIKWVRAADIGSPRGNSRIRSIQERTEGWLQKVQDNDAAIRSKAWPMIIFQMGSEDNPWSKDQIENFIQHYEDENLEPGLMQAVSGDVDVEEFAGETADIEATLQHDISTIMSGLPGPVYATGGFSQNVAPAVAQAQQRQFIKEVKYARRRLEEKIEPFLREVAEEYGLDAPDSVEFHVKRPHGDIAPEDVSGSIIRYTSDADPDAEGGPSAPGAGAQGGGGGGATNEGGTGAAAPQPGNANFSNDAGNVGGAGSASPTSTSDNAGFAMNEAEPADAEADSAELESVPAEELADPRLVSSTSEQDSLSSIVADVLVDARQNALDALQDEYANASIAGSADFPRLSNRAVDASMEQHNVASNARPIVSDTIEATIDTLNQDNHTPTMNLGMGARHEQSARDVSQRIERQVRDAAEAMLSDVQTVVESAAQQGDPVDRIAERVENQYDDGRLESRADIIAHMEVQNAINTTKLTEYERHPDVDGIRVINTCGPNTTDLCENLAGCGSREHAVAEFDEARSIGAQFGDHVGDHMLFDGYDPLPPAPPFHFGCTSEIVPITNNT